MKIILTIDDILRRSNVRRALFVLLIIAAACAPGSARSWGKGGHMMVAHIAWQHMGDYARQRAQQLLSIPLAETAHGDGGNYSAFLSASYWADDVRVLTPYKFSAPYHFIDYPFSSDRTPLPGNLPAAQNVVRALNKYVVALKVATTSEETKAEALRFVIHFVGDIHQPLHCTSRITKQRPDGDKGGNTFRIRVPGTRETGRVANLHAYWDAGLNSFPQTGSDYSAPPSDAIPAAADTAMQDNPFTSTAWRKAGTFAYDHWAMESYAAARDVVYQGIEEEAEVSSNYEQRGRALSNRRIAWAGYRLARLLNALWPDPPR